MTRRVFLAVVFLCTVVTAGAEAQSLDPIRYTLRFPAPHTHYVEIEAALPTGGRPQIEVYMATWTPGSYLIREYERHVEAVSANAAGRALNVTKSTKNRWRITTGGAANVTLRYKVYGREMTVRNNWIESAFAMINGAPTFITLVERAARPHEVRVELPAAWKRVETALMPIAGSTNAFRAEDFDTLVDSPIIIGNPVTREFTVDNKKHVLLFEGDTALVDADRAVADVQKIVEAGRSVMGSLPYPHYYFMTMVTEQSGALEHKNSYLGMTGRYVTRTRGAYMGWLGTLAH
jgi:predicted metalloprotease with PDZ domain